MSDKGRLILVAVLMTAVLFVSWKFISGNNQDESGETIEISQSSAEINATLSNTDAEEIETEETHPTDTLTSGTEQDSTDISNVIREQSVVVIIYDEDGEAMVEGTISTHSGGVTSWELLKYPDNPGSEQTGNVNFNGDNWMFWGVDFDYTGPDTIRVRNVEEKKVIFTHSDSTSIEYTFRGGFYGFEFENIGMRGIPYVPAGVLPVSEQKVNEARYFKAGWYAEKVQDKDAKDLQVELPTGNVRWLATRSHYFAIILIPESNDERAYGKIYLCNEDQSPAIGIQDNKITVYAGPLDYNELQGLGRDTRRLIDFGWPVIRDIGRLIFWFLNSVLGFIHNWGLKIIVLSIALKVILLPLTQKSFKSMAMMKEVQPKMKEIQAKYKNDPKAQQAAMQKLYKDEGVNPLGGCLPMIMQMPVFFALYRVLANTVQLRGAPFFLWIQDLSRPEILIPFNSPILGLHGVGLLAIMMGAAMFFQQKLTMTDQSQKGMMYMMPLFMMFIFMRFPAGLTLYWFANNLLTIVQQEYIKKQMEKKKPA